MITMRRYFGRWCLVTLCVVLFCKPQGADASCKWVQTPSDNANGLDNSLMDVSAISGNDAWAAGSYYDFRNHQKVQTLIEHWDGARWTLAPSANAMRGSRPLDNYLFGIASDSASDVWAVGSADTRTLNEQTLAEHWSGTAWTIVPSPNAGTPNRLRSVTVISPSDAWAVGYYHPTQNIAQTLTEHWNGATWSVVQSPNIGSSINDLARVAAVSTSDVWAVGYYDDAAGNSRNLIEHWNGSKWKVVLNPSAGQSRLAGVAVESPSDIWAVGSWSHVQGGQMSSTAIEHWNGVRWSLVPSPSPSNDLNMLAGVSGASSGDVWAVGVQGPAGSETLTEHWDGSQWTVVPSPNRLIGNTNELLSVAAPAQNDILTVGDFVNSGGHFRTLTLLFHC